MMDCPLLQVAMGYIQDEIPDASNELLYEVKQVFSGLIANPSLYQIYRDRVKELIGSTDIISKIHTIITVSQNPHDYVLPDPEEQDDKPSLGRRKARPWTQDEDLRLLAGIHIYGLDNWNSVVPLVGAGRTRPQCSQRWFRGIDPKISKRKWTEEENKELFNLVNQYGENAWSKISSEMGSRSDVQCRYHYFQMKKSKTTVKGIKKTRKSPETPKEICNNNFGKNDLSLINTIFKFDESLDSNFFTYLWNPTTGSGTKGDFF